MKSTVVCLAALGALSLAACGQSAGSATSAETPPQAGTTTTPAPAAVASSSAASVSPSAPTTAAPAGEPRVVVDNEAGVQITPAAGGQTITVAFGTPRAQARATLVAALGQPLEAANPDCPWGPATLWDWSSGQAVVVNDALVGWSSGARDFGYTCIAD